VQDHQQLEAASLAESALLMAETERAKKATTG